MSDIKDDNEKKAHHSRMVRIHIDQSPHQSPDPTTGDALYLLGKVKPDLRLFREVKGDHEDPTIEKGPEKVHLTEDEHFHSGPVRVIVIIVNGTPHDWPKDRITFVEVVTLDDPSFPQHPEITYSVKYKKGPAHKPEGILAPNSPPLRIKEGMVFTVTKTGQS